MEWSRLQEWANLLQKGFSDLPPEAVFLVVCDPPMNEL